MPREAMELTRHTNRQLAKVHYTDARVFDLAAPVEALPIPEFKPDDQQRQRATGTTSGKGAAGAQRVARALIDSGRQSVTCEHRAARKRACRRLSLTVAACLSGGRNWGTRIRT